MYIGAAVEAKIGRLKSMAKPTGIFIIGFILGCVLCGSDRLANMTIRQGDNTEISFGTRELNDVEFVQSAWEDDDRRAILLSALAQRGIYEAGDPRIVQAISDLCGPIPEEPLEEYLEAAQACAEQEVPRRLRVLSRRGSPPFHPTGRIVSIGVPENEPPLGTANTCQNGELYRRRVELVNRQDGRTVTVFASGHYGRGICVGTADVQLNAEDALAIIDPPLDMFEEALATIVD